MYHITYSGYCVLSGETEWMSIWVALKFLNFCPVAYSSILRPLIEDHFILCFCLLRRLLEGVLCPNSYKQVRWCHGHQESGELLRWRLRGSRRVLGARLGEQRLQRGPRGYCRCEGKHPDRREVIVYLMLSVISRSLLAIWNLSKHLHHFKLHLKLKMEIDMMCKRWNMVTVVLSMTNRYSNIMKQCTSHQYGKICDMSMLQK